MPAYVAYYRVSTDRQGVSGLGLDAQRAAVARHLNGQGQLIGEYAEIESGRRHTNRPQLLAALEECRKRRAVLLIARLDPVRDKPRLSRRGRIAQTPRGVPLFVTEVSVVVRCTGVKPRSERLRSYRRSSWATRAHLPTASFECSGDSSFGLSGWRRPSDCSPSWKLRPSADNSRADGRDYPPRRTPPTPPQTFGRRW